jgi:hypothetical protein
MTMKGKATSIGVTPLAMLINADTDDYQEIQLEVWVSQLNNLMKVEDINMALFERVIRDLMTQDEFALDEEMTNLEAAAFIAEAREEIERATES